MAANITKKESYPNVIHLPRELYISFVSNLAKNIKLNETLYLSLPTCRVQRKVLNGTIRTDSAKSHRIHIDNQSLYTTDWVRKRRQPVWLPVCQKLEVTVAS